MKLRKSKGLPLMHAASASATWGDDANLAGGPSQTSASAEGKCGRGEHPPRRRAWMQLFPGGVASCTVVSGSGFRGKPPLRMATRQSQEERVPRAAVCEMLSDPTSSCPLRNFGENVLLRATAGHSREEIGVGGPDGQGVCLHLPAHSTSLVCLSFPREGHSSLVFQHPSLRGARTPGSSWDIWWIEMGTGALNRASQT